MEGLIISLSTNIVKMYNTKIYLCVALLNKTTGYDCISGDTAKSIHLPDGKQPASTRASFRQG